MAEFVPVVRNRLILVSGRQKRTTDFGLLHRVFTNASWMGIVMLFLILILFFVIVRVLSNEKYKKSMKAMVF